MYGDYTDPNGDSHVAEWTMQGDAPKPGTRRQLLFQKQPYANHNGGQVMIGPDNMLYVAFGDGGSAGDPQGNGQNLGTWLGKILRIDPRPHGTSPYGVPGSNPFVGQIGRRAEIWMYGLRNPWRSSFDRARHDMWIGDVGQDLYEEVDYAPAASRGQNWGWGDREGFHAYDGRPRPANAKDPILERAHSLGDCAVIGGYVYNGPAITALRGAYVFGDLCTGELRAVYQTFGTIRSRRDLGLHVSMLSTFGEGPAGELYAVSHGGTVFKIVPSVT
jgi:glucose/arabinose dehydrogenase